MTVTREPASTRTSLRRTAGALLLVGYALVVGASGFAWPLGQAWRSVWPFKNGWFMFHTEDGRFYHLGFEALRGDGRRETVDMERWFRWPASEATRRYDEVARTPDNLRALVGYVCRRHNRDAREGDRWRSVTVTDTIWLQRRGARVPLESVPTRDRYVTTHLRDEPCPEPP